jgi:hypothetical protein
MLECPAGKLVGFFMRFTIRDLLWLIVVAAMGCAWGTEYYRSDRRWLEFKADSLEGILQDKGYDVEFQWPETVKVGKGANEYSLRQRLPDITPPNY